MRIALFATCLGDTVFPDVPRAVVAVLERLGHEVVFPEAQTCCGQLHLNSGYAEDRSLRGAFAVTLHLLRQAFGKRRAGDPWQEATTQAGVAWDLAVKGGRR